MSKPAFIKWYGEKNGNERRATLRAGAKGTGKVLQTATYWPNHGASLGAAYDTFAEVAEREGYTIVGTDRDEE